MVKRFNVCGLGCEAGAEWGAKVVQRGCENILKGARSFYLYEFSEYAAVVIEFGG